MEEFQRRLDRAGVLDAAVTFGDGLLSFTGQIESVNVLTALTVMVVGLGDYTSNLISIEVTPCQETKPELQSVAV